MAKMPQNVMRMSILYQINYEIALGLGLVCQMAKRYGIKGSAVYHRQCLKDETGQC